MSKNEVLYNKGFQCMDCGTIYRPLFGHNTPITECVNCGSTNIEKKELLQVGKNQYIGTGLADKRQSNEYIKEIG